MQTTTISTNGYHREHNALLAASQIAQLQQRLTIAQADNSELNKRLSAQNRPGKRLGGCIEVASVILSEHLMGGTVGIVSLQKKYPSVSRRKREWGLALLIMAGIVTNVDRNGVRFNEKMTVQRAWEKLTVLSESLGKQPDPIRQLRAYLPEYR